MLKHAPFSGPKSVTSAAPIIIVKDSDTYPVLASIGIDNWPDVETFEELSTPVQFAWAAQRGTTDTTEQQADFFVIGTQTAASQNQSGSFHGAAATNHNFISHYYQGAGSSYGALVNTSWQAYLNWVLGIDDGNSNGVWNGTEADIESYKYWYVHSRKFSFNAVPHNGW